MSTIQSLMSAAWIWSQAHVFLAVLAALFVFFFVMPMIAVVVLMFVGQVMSEGAPNPNGKSLDDLDREIAMRSAAAGFKKA